MATCSISWSGHRRYVERPSLDGYVDSRAHHTGGVHWMISTSCWKFLFVLRLVFEPYGAKRSNCDFYSDFFNRSFSKLYDDLMYFRLAIWDLQQAGIERNR